MTQPTDPRDDRIEIRTIDVFAHSTLSRLVGVRTRSSSTPLVLTLFPPSYRPTKQARTALRRGAVLLKYCRNASPHVAHFQLSKDEGRLEWVSKNAKVKWVAVESIVDVVAGRTTEIFAKNASTTETHPPDVCLSVLYRDAKQKHQSLNLVFEEPGTMHVWRTGLLATKELALTKDESKNDAPAMGVTTAIAVNKAANVFKRTLSTKKDEDDVRAANKRNSPIAEPNDLFVWGRVARLDGGGAFAPTDSVGTSGRDETISVSSRLRDDGSDKRRSSIAGNNNAGIPRVHSSALLSATASATPRRVAGTDGVDVTNVAMGPSHVAAVCAGQGVYTWGFGCGGRLGHGTHASHDRPKQLIWSGGGTHSVTNDYDQNDSGRNALATTKTICCAGSVTFAVTDDGNVSVWGDAGGSDVSVFGLGEGNGGGGSGSGSNANIASATKWKPTVLTGLLSKKVTHIAASKGHVAAVADDGTLWTWGEGVFGVLGHGDEKVNGGNGKVNLGKETGMTSGKATEMTSRSCYAPRKVAALVGKKVTSVSCGSWHTAAVVDGTLWAWGDPDGGKLGLGNACGSQTQWLPQHVEGVESAETVSCGVWHTLCLTTDGAVWQCGAVGGGEVSAVHKTPTKVSFLTGTDDGKTTASARCIASGDLHAAVFLKTGSPNTSGIYTWGIGTRGQLGHGDTANAGSPKLVAALLGREVVTVQCGPTSTAAVASAQSRSVTEKARDAKFGGAKVTKRFDAVKRRSVVSLIQVPERTEVGGGGGGGRVGRTSVVIAAQTTETRRVSIGPTTASLGGVDGLATTFATSSSRRSSFADFSLARVSVDSGRMSETNGSDGGVSRGGSRRGQRADDGFERFDPESVHRGGSFAFASPRSIGAESFSPSTSHARSRPEDVSFAFAATARARAETARAVNERDALRLELAALRLALRVAERDEVTSSASVASPVVASVTTHSVATSMTPRLPNSVTTAMTPRVSAPPAETELTPPPEEELIPPPETELTTSHETELPTAKPPQTPPPVATPVPNVTSTPVPAATPNATANTTPTHVTVTTSNASPGTPMDTTPDNVRHIGGSEPARSAPSPSPSPSPQPAAVPSQFGVVDAETCDVQSPTETWIEEVEPGVFMTIGVDQGSGQHVLRRVRFSKRVFSDTEATAWWTKNRARVVRTRGLKMVANGK